MGSIFASLLIAGILSPLLTLFTGWLYVIFSGKKDIFKSACELKLIGASDEIVNQKYPFSHEVIGRFLMVYIVLSMVILIICLIISSRGKRVENSNVYGNSRYSKIDEITKLGLQGDGIVLGKIGNKLISKPPTVEGHVLVVGGTGSGKSRGIVIPTLFKWNGSAIIMDIKGELSAITSQYRAKKGSKVYIFNPEGEGQRYNPIALCKTVDQAQTLARALIPLPETGDTFWCESAQAILSAFVFEGAKKGYYLCDIAENLCTTPITELIEHCRNHEMREVKLLCSIAYDIPEKTLGGVIAQLKSRLITIATDENIRRATSGDDWTPSTLELGATIYLKVSEHHNKIIHPPLIMSIYYILDYIVIFYTSMILTFNTSVFILHNFGIISKLNTKKKVLQPVKISTFL